MKQAKVYNVLNKFYCVFHSGKRFSYERGITFCEKATFSLENDVFNYYQQTRWNLGPNEGASGRDCARGGRARVRG